jgi:hypothetical protein
LHILVFAALVTVTFLGLRPLWETMQERMGKVRDSFIAAAETGIRRRITYTSMGPSVFGGMDIRDIRVFGAGAAANEAPVIFVSRLRLSWSLMDLIRGRSGSIRSIRIDRPTLNFEYERDKDILDMLASLQTGDRDTSGGLSAWIPGEVFFRVRNGKALITGDGLFRVDKLNFDASLKDRRITVQGNWNAAASLPDFFGSPAVVEMSGRISGSGSADFSEGNALVTIPFVAGSGGGGGTEAGQFRCMALGINVSFRDRRLEARKVNDRSPLDLALDYDFDTRQLSASLRCEDFSPRELLSLSGAWRSVNPWLAVQSAGEAALEADDAGNIRYTVDLSGTLPKNLPMGGGAFTLRGSGDGEQVSFDRLSLRTPQGDIEYRGGLGLKPLAPNGTIRINDFSIAPGNTGTERFSADLSVNTQGSEISLFAETAALGDVELSALDIALRRADGGLAFSAAALRFRDVESYEDVSLSTLSLEGSFDYEPRHVEASFLLDSFSVADLTGMIKPFVPKPLLPEIAETIARNISVTTELFIVTDFEQTLYNVPRLLVVYVGSQDMIALFSLSGTDRRFEISEGQLIWANDALQLAGAIDFSNPLDISFSLSTTYQDMSYFFEGVFLDGNSLSVQGSYGLQAYISSAGIRGYSGYLQAEDIPVPFRGQFARLRFSTSLRYDSADFWSLDINGLELREVATPGSPAAALRISGVADQDGGVFDDLFFDDGRGALNGRAALSWNRDFSRIQGQTTISNAALTEIYRAEAFWQDRRFDLTLSGAGMQLDHFFENARNAAASGDVLISWDSINSFRADINLASLSAHDRDTEFDASLSAVMDSDEFFLRDLRANFNGLDATVPWLRISRKDAEAGAAGRLRGTALGRTVDISFDLDARFKAINSWLGIGTALNSFEGALNISAIRMDTLESTEPFNFVFSREGPQAAFSGGPQNMIRFRISEEGDFYAGFSYPSPIRGSVIGALSAGTIDAQASDIYVDLASLWRFIPRKEIVNVTGGYATASIQIRGALGDPEFYGAALGSSVRLQVPQYLSADVQPIPIAIHLEGNEMSFGPIPAVVGSGSAAIAGWFRFDRWIPNTFSLDIAVPDETPLPFKFDISGVLAEGLAAGNLNLAMEDLVFAVTGDLLAPEAEISLDTTEMAQARQRRAELLTQQKPVIVDVGVTAGRKLEFLWPSRNFPILRAYADMGTKVLIGSDNVTRRFSFTGDVKLRSGELFYFERSFYIRNGTLSFNESEAAFDPRITVRAEVRDRTNEGPVTISLIVDNAPLSSFTARFESTPVLSQIEIFSLLGQNITGTSGTGENGQINNAFLASSTDILAQFQVVRRLERAVRNFTHLDMFSVRTQVLQNTVFRLTGLQDPVDRNGIGNYFDNTSVLIGKYIGNDIFARTMLSLRYDANKSTFGGYTFEPDFGVELQSPLGNISWNLVPVHPETWFLQDNSFTLSWSFSF